MELSTATDIVREGIGVVIKVGGPMLLLGMMVGVFIAVFQAVTQIHEQTISFILKLIVVGLVLLVGGDWMMRILQEYTREVFLLMNP